MQKVIAKIYRKQVSKIYSEDRFICNFVLEYMNHLNESSKMFCHLINSEPIIDSTTTWYLVELEVNSYPNTKFNNGQAYVPQVRVYSIEPIKTQSEFEAAAIEVENWYRECHNMPFDTRSPVKRYKIGRI